MSLGARLFEEALKKIQGDHKRRKIEAMHEKAAVLPLDEEAVAEGDAIAAVVREKLMSHCDCDVWFNPYTKTFLHRPFCYVIKHLADG